MAAASATVTTVAAAGSAGKSAGSSSSVKPSAVAMRRLMADLRELERDTPEGISAAPISDANLLVWNASIFGPDETPWEGGIYPLRLTFPPQYPTKPPRVVFLCEMYHPNVYADGNLCLDIIQDKWTPVYTVGKLLQSILSLLTDPNPNSPANPAAAKLYRENRKQYNRKVRRVAERSLDCGS